MEIYLQVQFTKINGLVMAWCWSGDKPLAEPMMTHLLTNMYHQAPMSFVLQEQVRMDVFHPLAGLDQYTNLVIPAQTGFPQGLENLEKWNFLEKSSKVMELWKIIKSHGKVMKLRKSHTDKSSPSIRNLALISFASHLVSCIHSNTPDYELLEEFEANPLVYCYWFLI